jgi:hypothetical protein
MMNISGDPFVFVCIALYRERSSKPIFEVEMKRHRAIASYPSTPLRMITPET